MASTDARLIPVKNLAYRVTFPIYDADGDTVTGATGLDSEVSKDGAGFADCTNEATEIGSTGIYYLDLTATEMNADTVAVRVQTSSSGAKTSVLIFYPLKFTEPAAVPGYDAGGPGLEELLAWLLALSRNKITQTSTTSTLRNDADSGTIATSTVSDSGGTMTRGEWG